MKLPRLTAHLVHRAWLMTNGAYRTQAPSIQPTALTPDKPPCGCYMDADGDCLEDMWDDRCPTGKIPQCAKVYPNTPFGKPRCDCICVKAP